MDFNSQSIKAMAIRSVSGNTALDSKIEVIDYQQNFYQKDSRTEPRSNLVLIDTYFSPTED